MIRSKLTLSKFFIINQILHLLMKDDHYNRFEGGAEVAADTMRGLTKATFDHTKDYDEYNRKYDAMLDDDSSIPDLLKELKK